MKTIETGDTVTIKGIAYIVLSAKPYTYKGDNRVSYTMKRPRGRLTYYVVQYSNGTMSDPV